MRLPVSRPLLVTGKSPSFPVLFETIPEPIGPVHLDLRDSHRLETVPASLRARTSQQPRVREEGAVKAILLPPRKGGSESKAEP